MKKYMFIISSLLPFMSHAQEKRDTSHLSIGVEADALPYATGGYYGSVWLAKDHFRYRAIVTNITTPNFMIGDKFTNNKMMVYALIADYFFEPTVKKWWVGTGVEYWDAKVQSYEQLSIARYNSVVLTVGGGYIWKFYRNFYLNPWAAVHVRVAGDGQIPVDRQVFKPSLLTLEGSVKIGWYFNARK